MTTYAFPGFDTGKRWHIMRQFEIEDRDLGAWRSEPDKHLISICKALLVEKNNGQKHSFDPIIMESEKAPIPLCAHCRRLSG